MRVACGPTVLDFRKVKSIFNIKKKDLFNVFLTVHRDISVQYEPTGCTDYFQFIAIINLYIFQAGLLLIIRRYYCVYIQQLVHVMLKVMELFKFT